MCEGREETNSGVSIGGRVSCFGVSAVFQGQTPKLASGDRVAVLTLLPKVCLDLRRLLCLCSSVLPS